MGKLIFYLWQKSEQMIPVETVPGEISGIMIFQSVIRIPAPSIAAASSISFGIPFTNPVSNQSAAGTFKSA
jgi:hypothetical protein